MAEKYLHTRPVRRQHFPSWIFLILPWLSRQVQDPRVSSGRQQPRRLRTISASIPACPSCRLWLLMQVQPGDSGFLPQWAFSILCGGLAFGGGQVCRTNKAPGGVPCLERPEKNGWVKLYLAYCRLHVQRGPSTCIVMDIWKYYWHISPKNIFIVAKKLYHNNSSQCALRAHSSVVLCLFV